MQGNKSWALQKVRPWKMGREVVKLRQKPSAEETTLFIGLMSCSITSIVCSIRDSAWGVLQLAKILTAIRLIAEDEITLMGARISTVPLE